MSVRIIKAGVLDSVQDLGRHGFQQLGINPGGVMDAWSAALANSLVGNNKKEAVLEIHYPASEFFFEEAALISVCGADFSANINAEEIPVGQPVLVNRFSILQFYGRKKGARAYLAVHGGFNIPAWLNSFSTNLKAASGGYKGRSLHKEDEILIHNVPEAWSAVLETKEFLILPWKAETAANDAVSENIFILKGNEWNNLCDASKEKILAQPFAVLPQSDRMGYKLKGEKLSVTTDEELISSAVSFGTLQLLPDGQVTLLMADHQTTGGYPRIAHVISAHLPLLAQKIAGDTIYFQLTDQQTAEDLWINQQQHLLQLQNACTFRIQEYFKNKSV